MTKQYRARQFQKGNRDVNEKQITPVLQAAGVMYRLLPPGFGADILLVTKPMAFVEVKSGDGAKLTETEKIMRWHCEEHGIDYYVIRTPEEAAAMLNRMAERTAE